MLFAVAVVVDLCCLWLRLKLSFVRCLSSGGCCVVVLNVVVFVAVLWRVFVVVAVVAVFVVVCRRCRCCLS